MSTLRNSFYYKCYVCTHVFQVTIVLQPVVECFYRCPYCHHDHYFPSAGEVSSLIPPSPPPQQDAVMSFNYNSGSEGVPDSTSNISSQLPALKSSVQSLPIIRMFEDSSDSCMICLEEFKLVPNIEVFKLPCQHYFHRSCILTWFSKSHTCPLCRCRMTTEFCAMVRHHVADDEAVNLPRNFLPALPLEVYWRVFVRPTAGQRERIAREELLNEPLD